MVGRDQRLAVITGGNRGLGRNTVLRLAERGIHSILTYRTHREEADEVIELVEKAGARAAALQLDTGKIDTFDKFVNEVSQIVGEFGLQRVDYLVNNAGMASNGKSIADTTEAELDALYNVHFKGVLFLTQKLLPLINDGGRIVNVSSALTRIILPNRGPYGAIKGAVEVLTKYMAKELGSRGITVNVVAPGAIVTDFGGGGLRTNAAMQTTIAGMTALGRVGMPDDVGPVIAALLSEDNRWVNGQRIEVSGGMMI